MRPTHCIVLAAGFTAGLGLVAAPAAHADSVTGMSSAYGVQVDLDVVNTIGVNLLEPNDVLNQRASGAAPASYNADKSAVDLEFNAGADLRVLGTGLNIDLASIDGVLSATASSDIDGAPGNRTTSASSDIAGLSVDAGDIGTYLLGQEVLGVDLVSLNSDTLNTTASVTGDYGNFTVAGDSSIEGLDLSIAGIDLLATNADLDASGNIHADPNTEILNVGGIAGLSLILNEQTLTGDGLAAAGIDVNAIHLSFDAVDLSGLGLAGLGLIDGDIVIGHADASVTASPAATAVPTPTAAAMATLCLGGLVFRRRRRAIV